MENIILGKFNSDNKIELSEDMKPANETIVFEETEEGTILKFVDASKIDEESLQTLRK